MLLILFFFPIYNPPLKAIRGGYTLSIPWLLVLPPEVLGGGAFSGFTSPSTSFCTSFSNIRTHFTPLVLLLITLFFIKSLDELFARLGDLLIQLL